jgi:hypothetical protein
MEGKRPKTASPASTTTPAAATPPVGTVAGGNGRGNGEGAPDAQAAPPTLNGIRYPCLMNMDYHSSREAWLDQMHRWLMFAVIAAGASAFVDAWPVMKVAGPIIAVICGALDLTFDLSNRARAHAMFRRRYGEILGEATRSPDSLQVLQCKLDELSGEEEPAFHAQLALSAMKGQQATYGKITHPCRPNWFCRRLANIWRFDGYDFN